MAPQKPVRARIILSSGILTTMFLGAVGWAFTEVRKIAPMEVKQHYQDRTLERIEKKVDDMHWAMIKRNNLNPPKKK